MTRLFNRADVNFRPVTTIPSGAATSSAVDITQIGPRWVGVRIPSGFTQSDLILKGSASGWDWTTICGTANNTLRISGISGVSAPRAIPFPAEALIAGVFTHLRLESVSAGNDGLLQQTSARTVHFLFGG